MSTPHPSTEADITIHPMYHVNICPRSSPKQGLVNQQERALAKGRMTCLGSCSSYWLDLMASGVSYILCTLCSGDVHTVT